jgi:hypothetical protein
LKKQLKKFLSAKFKLFPVLLGVGFVPLVFAGDDSNLQLTGSSSNTTLSSSLGNIQVSGGSSISTDNINTAQLIIVSPGSSSTASSGSSSTASYSINTLSSNSQSSVSSSAISAPAIHPSSFATSSLIFNSASTTAFTDSLQVANIAALAVMHNAEMVMNGAHSSPMRGLLSSGRQSFWLGGDWGRSDHREANADVGSGEVGYGLGVNDHLMVKIALGRNYSKQDAIYGGATKVDGTYVIPELIYAIPNTSFYTTLTGQYNVASLNTKRGYISGGDIVASNGDTNSHAIALRVRLDWLNAIALGKTFFTPYTSVSFSKTKTDGYTETGGDLPVSWESRKENSSQFRLGADAVYKIDEQVSLLGRLEAVHRFESHGTSALGQVVGFTNFELAGISYKQDWLRVGLGAEAKFFKGTGSFMFNGTTEGGTPSHWLAASYRYDY